MNDTGRKMKLGAVLYPTGHHLGGWRHPDDSEWAKLLGLATKTMRQTADAAA